MFNNGTDKNKQKYENKNMKLFGYNFKKQEETVQNITTTQPQYKYMETVYKFNYQASEIPTIKESKRGRWVDYGSDNLYPQKLIEYADKSSIHGTALSNKAKMAAGSGFKIDGLNYQDYIDNLTDPIQKLNLITFFENPTGDQITSLYDLVCTMSYDWQLFGALSLETIWTMDHSKLAQVKALDTSRIRSGKMFEGAINEYFYCRDWKNYKKEKVLEYPTFGTTEEGIECLYIRDKKNGIDYYGKPGYTSGLKWISIDAQMAEFHDSNIKNGFAPSMLVKFYQVPDSPEQMDQVVSGIKEQFSGSENAGKAMIFFTDGKEVSPDVTPVAVSNLDKQFLVLGDQVVQQIITAHRLTSPAMAGIATPGKLGYSNELETAYEMFDKIVIQPDREVMQKTINILAKNFGLNVKIEISKFEPNSNKTNTLI